MNICSTLGIENLEFHFAMKRIHTICGSESPDQQAKIKLMLANMANDIQGLENFDDSFYMDSVDESQNSQRNLIQQMISRYNQLQCISSHNIQDQQMKRFLDT